jgi:hypothetical protein
MSEPDGFLTRWSRRKREADAKVRDASDRPGIPDESAPRELARRPDPPETSDSPSPVDPASLPPIESIEAATDIRAFLAKGVTPDLARAALRRAWLADPAIRDFVGLADYAWDFNAPDGMHGFGPLRSTDDVRQLLSQMIGNESPEVPPSSRDPQAVLSESDQVAEHPCVDQSIAPAKGRESDDSAPPVSDDSGTLPQVGDVAMQNPAGKGDPISQSRRHGSALPE